ncbi:MAG TPA: glucose-1-phosphate cytidylyltransferase [Candidatus Nanoarchaeia archaeon]|nr:glucose-1-phosphate cytidylyltransferase [Candidatus Nanoarchaeia archaeon]
MEKPKVVILCGGMGTRLREETEFKPKPLVRVGEYPILWHIMKTYSHYGFNDFVLCLGYKGEEIVRYFTNYRDTNDMTLNPRTRTRTLHGSRDYTPNWNITFAHTGLKSNTGSRIKQIEKYIPSDNFMVTYGDGVADVNIEQLSRFHHVHGKIATVTAVHPPPRFGTLKIDEEMLVQAFEKDKRSEDSWIDGGFFIFNRRIFDYLTTDIGCMLEGDTLPQLVKENNLKAYKHTGYWQCMDNVRDVETLNQIWDDGKAPWKVWK